jgi:hypothetical protein
MMSGPFSGLDHKPLLITAYSLRYTGTLMGAVGRKVKTNDLWLLLQKATNESLFTDPDEDLGYYRRVLHAKI